MKGVTTGVWVGWVGGVVVASIAGTFVALTFAYGQFETKDHAVVRADATGDRLTEVNRRLERIEQKIDSLGVR